MNALLISNDKYQAFSSIGSRGPLQPQIDEASLWSTLYSCGVQMTDDHGNITDRATWHLALLTAKIDAIGVAVGLMQGTGTAMAADVSAIKVGQAAMTEKIEGVEKRVEDLEGVVGPMAERSHKLMGIGVAAAGVMALFGAGATHWFELIWSKLMGDK